MRKKFNPKKLRERLEWTQAQMADYLGCDQSTVSRIEKGGPINGPVQRLLRQLVDQPAPTDTSVAA